MKKSYKKVSEESFGKIKALRNSGLKWRELAVIHFIPKNSYSRKAVDISTDFPEYQNLVAQYGKDTYLKRISKATLGKVKEPECEATLNTVVTALVEMKVSIDNLCELISKSGGKGKFKMW